MDPSNTTLEQLCAVIKEWNSNRLDLFEISTPNQDLEFNGVMRFYFQDAGQKVATKCIRVSSTASTDDVIGTLIEKFRPDIRMLSFAEYALYEIHESGEERKLEKDEKPLVVQLNWNKDDREGRFLLRRMDEKTILGGIDGRSKSGGMSSTTISSTGGKDDSSNGGAFRRKLSKRERKDKKKKEKEERAKDEEKSEADENLAEKLYNELPETSFTRSISNPEAVMRRRRQQKLEKKLQQLVDEGGSEAGGTLRIFGEQLNKGGSYKTLLLSKKENAAYVVKEILEKYGLDKENPKDYCLVQIIVPHNLVDLNKEASSSEMQHLSENIKEYILDDDDCPLMLEKMHNKAHGILTFYIRRRPENYEPRPRRGKFDPADAERTGHDYTATTPFLLEVNADGSDLSSHDRLARKHVLTKNVTEIGCSTAFSGHNYHGQNNNANRDILQLVGGNVQPKHCVISSIEGIVTVTPQIQADSDAETFVNGLKISDSTILKNGMLVRFGKQHTFRFVDPNHERCPSTVLSPDLLHQMSKLNQPNHNENNPNNSQSYHHQMSTEHDPGRSSQSRDSRVDVDDGADNVSNYSKTSRKSEDTLAAGDLIGAKGRNEAILPAILELWEETEDVFLNAILHNLDTSHVQFKLAPTYTVYMAIRYRASTHFLPSCTPEERAVRLTQFADKLSEQLLSLIKHQVRDASSLAFWLANASEMLHFLKQDRHLNAFTLNAQQTLADCVQIAFRQLVSCLELQLDTCVSGLFGQHEPEAKAAVHAVLHVLSRAMSLLRECRVNAALTIQLFSQLFHFINMRLFNQLIGIIDTSIQPPPPAPLVNYCSDAWGALLRSRLVDIEQWAERQGLELAADCYLGRIVQATLLLQSIANHPPESFPGFVSSQCFKLNSLQLRTLLQRFESSSNSKASALSSALVEQLVIGAEQSADELSRSYGRPIRLAEEPDLQLPFLLPEDGYSAGIVRRLPTALHDFIAPLVQRKLCALTIQPTSAGLWTIYLNSADSSLQVSAAGPTPVPSNSVSGPITATAKSIMSPLHPPFGPIAGNTPATSIQPMSPYYPNTVNAFQSPYHNYRHSNQPQSSLQSNAQPQMYSHPSNVNRPQPEVTVIKLRKGNSGMGLSIVAASPSTHEPTGIYIKNVVKDGAADQDGRLRAGDQLLKVDGHSLIGISQERAAELMTQSGAVVTLEVAKQAAAYNGLAAILQNQAQRNAASSAMLPKIASDDPLKKHSNSMAVLNSYSSYPYGNQSYQPYNNNGNHPANAYTMQMNQPMSPTIMYSPQMNSSSRPNSQIGIQTANRQSLYEDRTYQNIGSYQHPGPPPVLASSASMQRMQPIYSGDSQTLPAPGRPMSTILTSREQDQFGSLGMMANRTTQYNSMAQLPIQLRQSIAQQQAQQQQQMVNSMSAQTLPNSQSMYMMRSQSQMPMGPGGSQSTMSNPVGQQQQQQQAWSSPRNQPIYGTYQPMANQTLPGRLVPQPGPKPMRNASQMNQSMQSLASANAFSNMTGMGQPIDTIGMQSTPPPPQISYRYGVTGYPPKPGMSQSVPQPIYGTNGMNSVGSLSSISPWEREEKERQQQLKLEEVRRQREDEISELESLGPTRSNLQEDRLRKLRLEMEFQHRVDIVANQDDDEVEADEAEVLERAEQRERQLLRQEELERSRQRRLEWQQQQQQAQTEEQEQRLRRLKIEENKLKEELQVTQQVEDRLIREAKKRRDEPKIGMDPSNMTPDDGLSSQQQQKLERFLARAAAAPNNNNTISSSSTNIGSNYNNTSAINSNNILATSKPALRNGSDSNGPKKVSWNHAVNVVEQASDIQYADESDEAEPNAESNESDIEAMSMNSGSNGSHKRSETTTTIREEDEEEDEEEVEDSFTLQDIDEVLGAPVDTEFGPNGGQSNCTPNVIGAQEVYRDPRDRIKAEKQKQNHNSWTNQVPEKLSFHEKKKMFAMEADQMHEKEKLRMAKQPREIDTK